MPAKPGQNAEIHVDEDADLVFTVTDSAGASVDCTGGAASWAMHDDGPSGTVRLTKTEGAGITLGDGTATVAIADTDTDALSAGMYYHELRITLAGKSAITAYGFITLFPAATAAP